MQVGGYTSINSLESADVGNTGMARDRVLGYYQDFQSKLKDLMLTMTDTTKDLSLDGQVIKSEARGGAAEQFLVNNWLSEQDFIFNQLLDNYKFTLTLDKELRNISAV
jgi:hypothetical protein